ncbi:MAG: biotin/lipoyl-binding protein [Lachnospiraceae bacterium]
MKRIIVIVLVIALVFGAVQGGIYLVKKTQKKEVSVYAVRDFSMTEYWEDAMSSYGTVQAEKLQPIYLSDTETVNDLYVTEGQTVQKGDPLFSYDTTLTEIQLARQQIEIQQIQVELEQLKKELQTIQTYRPGVPIKEIASVSIFAQQEAVAVASSSEKFSILAAARSLAKRTDSNSPTESSSSSEEPTDSSDEDENSPEFLGGKGTIKAPYRYKWDTNYEYSTEFIEYVMRGQKEVYAAFEVYEERNDFENNEDLSKDELAMMENSPQLASWWMMKFVKSETNTAFQMIAMGIGEASYEMVPLPKDDDEPTTEPETEEPGWEEPSWDEPAWDEPAWDEPDDPGIIYTAEEIAQMLYEKQSEIQTKDIELRTAQLQYEKMQSELNDGIVYSELDGVVQDIGDSLTCKQTGSVFMNVSAGGGYYVEAYINELDLDNIHVGDLVDINAWESGMYYQGEIVEISNYPSTNNYSYSSNSNTSTYPIKIKLEEEAEVREYESVDITFESTQNQENSDGNTFYLEIPFVRTENGESYVWVADENHQMRRQTIQVGKIVWDSYIEIKSGLTMDDYIAFPYGSSLEEGAAAVEKSMDDLYSSY